MSSVDATVQGDARAQRSAQASTAGRFLATAVQLLLVLLVVHRFELEAGRGLLTLTPLVFGGFVVHAWLPMAWRTPFFLALSLAGFLLIFGLGLGALLVGIGLFLVGVCHLPLPWWLRIGLLLGAGGVLTAMRADLLPVAWAGAILPVLGSLFMFRLVLYVYDLRTEDSEATLWQRLSYFFLLPNVLFPLFPIVDYKTFLRTWYGRADHLIHAKGVDWMLRGVVQLLLYRVLYMNFTPAAAEVESLGMVAVYMLSSYLLYLRVSGLFHFIVGVLALFGFDLPETHHRWALASGFNDLWRRINIYWKDFMMKIVYYPIFVRMRRKDPTRAMVVATLVVFLVSWLLHSYQWFWVRGSFPLTVVDAIFWILFAFAVLANSLLQARGGARRASLTRRRVTRHEALVHALKVVGMFSFMCVFWSFWTGADLAAFGELVAVAARAPAIDVFALAGVLLGAVMIGMLYQLVVQVPWERWQAGRSYASRWTSGSALLLALLAFGTPGLTGMEDDAFVRSVRTEGLNRHDEELLLRGYYEELLVEERHLGMMSELQGQRPEGWDLSLAKTAIVQHEEGTIREFTLVPEAEIVYRDAVVTTNRWGMRDGDYVKAKPAGTCRIAVLGASIEMGSGVEDDELFEALVEERLNAINPGTTWERFEVLNFAVNGYTLLHQIEVMGRQAQAFFPDVVLLFSHAADERILRNHLERILRKGVDLPYAWLADYFARNGLDAETTERELRIVHKRTQDELTSWCYRQIVQRCERKGALPAWVFLQHPPVQDAIQARRAENLERLAADAGMVTIVLDHERIFHDERDWRDLVLAPWDNHPNPEGHRRIADELMERLLARSDELGLGLR